MEGGLDGEAASEEIDGSPGCLLVQSLEPLVGDLVVEGEDVQLALAEDEAGESAEEHRLPVPLVHSKGSSRVAGSGLLAWCRASPAGSTEYRAWS